MSFLHQHNEVCQSSSLSSELMGNKAVDFHKQITLLNFNKFQFNKITGSQQMPLQSEMMSVTFQA